LKIAALLQTAPNKAAVLVFLPHGELWDTPAEVHVRDELFRNGPMTFASVTAPLDQTGEQLSFIDPNIGVSNCTQNGQLSSQKCIQTSCHRTLLILWRKL
jgi:hypothetical protein